ncbi:hypothetical protein BZA70DRAFT_290573 [Myxozyma melibiosi]|uniref:RING-CH-type domain-containing protein n=1 Tax=Myxozyma melibiosi TaxID=54550 RepID=A0ABR1F2F1_9ASCO
MEEVADKVGEAAPALDSAVAAEQDPNSSVSPASNDFISCWICLGTSNDPPPDGSSSHNWRHPCKCSLVAHESCLLTWIEPNQDFKECPQCRAPIAPIEPPVPPTLRLQQSLRAIAKFSLITGFSFGLVRPISAVVFRNFYALGAVSILSTFSPEESIALLALDQVQPSKKAFFYQNFVRYLRSDKTWRQASITGLKVLSRFADLDRTVSPIDSFRMLTIATIPFALVCSRTYLSQASLAMISSVVLPLASLPFDEKRGYSIGRSLHLSTISALLLLPVAAIGYESLYNKHVVPRMLWWKQQADLYSYRQQQLPPVEADGPVEEDGGEDGAEDEVAEVENEDREGTELTAALEQLEEVSWAVQGVAEEMPVARESGVFDEIQNNIGALMGEIRELEVDYNMHRRLQAIMGRGPQPRQEQRQQPEEGEGDEDGWVDDDGEEEEDNEVEEDRVQEEHQVEEEIIEQPQPLIEEIQPVQEEEAAAGEGAAQDAMGIAINADLGALGGMAMWKFKGASNVFNGRDMLVTMLGALGFPVVSGLTGDAMVSLLPKAMLKHMPKRFVRSLLSGILVLLANNAFEMYCAYLKAQKPKMRRIRDCVKAK